MAKSKLIDRVWIVISDDGFHSASVTFENAEIEAKDLVESGKLEVQIFEVVSAWSVDYPEEPDPVASQIDLDIL